MALRQNVIAPPTQCYPLPAIESILTMDWPSGVTLEGVGRRSIFQKKTFIKEKETNEVL